MNSSILCDVREMCDAGRDNNAFDGQLIPLINSFLFRAAQFGTGKKGFAITSTNETWANFLGDDAEHFAALKDYIALRVRLIFDPPDNSAVLTSYREDAKELEWSLYNEAEFGD